MAQVTPIARHLQLQFQNGTTASGLPRLRNRNYPHVSPAAADDDVLAVGQALANLASEPVYAIARVDQAGLAPSGASSTAKA
ncbi:MAG: DUF1659 domain-containing protein [Chloroflexi bacterium]|uniref:DUF1659 domain-containing protein n=1 Tax=Alicyclobacillus cellulosilyticus TaxID=1003997 RepID=A0A917K8P4_9BACL|nr:DUF1659 domain-containing protein [Alicyclobacillus cellulosilyticus]MBX6773467.1 DUF1659 domain-containing protein [Chloroflexota bacterium]GGJ04072.1 hypothetical protein GCM10010885_11670 [Alicyclobacillus cellulosilyticus]